MSLQKGWAKTFHPRPKRREPRHLATIERTQQQIAAALERRAQQKSKKT